MRTLDNYVIFLYHCFMDAKGFSSTAQSQIGYAEIYNLMPGVRPKNTAHSYPTGWSRWYDLAARGIGS